MTQTNKSTTTLQDNSDALNRLTLLDYSIAAFKHWLVENKIEYEDLDEDNLNLRMDEYIDYKKSLYNVKIDESNFDQYFFDTYKHGPKPGQVLACYEADAELIDSEFKRSLVTLLSEQDMTVEVCVRMLQKQTGATYQSALSLVKELINGLLHQDKEEVLSQPHEFKISKAFYTEKECLPIDDPNWFSASLIDVRCNGSDYTTSNSDENSI